MLEYFTSRDLFYNKPNEMDFLEYKLMILFMCL